MVKKLEKIFKALGDKNRLRIVNMLGEKSMCVCEITQVLQISQSTVSGHLRVLKEASILEDSKDGLWVEYRLCMKDNFIKELLLSIENLTGQDQEMRAERLHALKADRNVLCKK